jgi:hypothetical protein
MALEKATTDTGTAGFAAKDLAFEIGTVVDSLPFDKMVLSAKEEEEVRSKKAIHL